MVYWGGKREQNNIYVICLVVRHYRTLISSLKPINDNLLVKYQFKTKPKKLRIGFVSGDFREHPVGFFLLDTLHHLKNENLEFEIIKILS